ncbi:hypothetical protein V5O48_018543 [Marasmius crinis-equi]|uniref:Uncharacterized protein n=1 Tax=Marasmius crinis-equi TaxID=585013 RepID=A0ABR3EKY6_9AGAR
MDDNSQTDSTGSQRPLYLFGCKIVAEEVGDWLSYALDLEMPTEDACSRQAMGPPSDHRQEAPDGGDSSLDEKDAPEVLESLERERDLIEEEIKELVLERGRLRQTIAWEKRNVFEPDLAAYRKELESVRKHREQHTDCRCSFFLLNEYEDSWKSSQNHLRNARTRTEDLTERITTLDAKSRELEQKIDDLC